MAAFPQQLQFRLQPAGVGPRPVVVRQVRVALGLLAPPRSLAQHLQPERRLDAGGVVGQRLLIRLFGFVGPAAPQRRG